MWRLDYTEDAEPRRFTLLCNSTSLPFVSLILQLAETNRDLDKKANTLRKQSNIIDKNDTTIRAIKNMMWFTEKYNEIMKVDGGNSRISQPSCKQYRSGASRLTRTKDNVPEELYSTVSLATNNFSAVHSTAIRMIRRSLSPSLRFRVHRLPIFRK